MKSFSSVLALAAIVSFVLFAENGLTEETEWWSYDKNEVPELLPKKMANKDDEEIRKAVHEAFQIQFDVITQHNGHSLDPEMPPIGYFNDEIPLTDVRTTNPETDLIFTNNNVTGFVGNKNNVVIKWVPNQVVTEITWNELKIKGKYTFSNNTYFNQGQYLIELQGVKYHAATTLRENIQKYPSSVPKSSISYSDAKVSFSNGLSDITKPSDSSNVNYLLDVIVRQQVADRVAKDAHKNATLAVWKVAKPFIVFKNYTDPFFPGVTGTLPDSAATKYVVDKFPLSGLENIRHQVKNVYAHMATNMVKIDLQLTAHYLNGYYNYRLGDNKENSTGSFTIVRMDIEVVFNVLDVKSDCKTVTKFVDPVNTFDTKGFGDTEVGQLLTKAFFDHIKEEINVSYCKCMEKWYNS